MPPRKEPKPRSFCARCGKPIRATYKYCGEDSRWAASMRALAETKLADDNLLTDLHVLKLSFAAIARRDGVSRAAVGQRYRRALARQEKRA